MLIICRFDITPVEVFVELRLAGNDLVAGRRSLMLRRPRRWLC
jgi:hypothetical protein